MSLSTVAHETFVIERIYDVPVAQTFRAWADPLLKARWFAGSADALGAGYELDFRVGGREANRGALRAGLSTPTSRSSGTSSPSSGSSTRTKCMPTSPGSRCPSPPSCSAATMRRRSWSSPNRGCSSMATTRRLSGKREPVPSGLARSQPEEWRIVRKTLLRLRRPVETAQLSAATSRSSSNVTSSCSQFCRFARRLRHR